MNSILKSALALSLVAFITVGCSKTESDADLQKKVETAITESHVAVADTVKVQVTKGTIYLTGTVDTTLEAANVDAVVKKVAPGAKLVDSLTAGSPN